MEHKLTATELEEFLTPIVKKIIDGMKPTVTIGFGRNDTEITATAVFKGTHGSGEIMHYVAEPIIMPANEEYKKKSYTIEYTVPVDIGSLDRKTITRNIRE